MLTRCIHGSPTEHCASSRHCPRGLAVNRCRRCRAATTTLKALATKARGEQTKA